MTLPVTEAPAATLRRGADKLRTLAAEATPGPWRDWGETYPHLVLQGPPGPPAEAEGLISTCLAVNERADASYIAAMSPTVGAALADWLELQADVIHGRTVSDGSDEYAVDISGDHALAVARQILVETAEVTH